MGVRQEHSDKVASWSSFWPLRPGVLANVDSKLKAVSGRPNEDAEDLDPERAFDIADSMEKGFARELATDFMHPLRRSRTLWKFNVIRSDDKLQYRLFSAEGDFLMFARVNSEARLVSVFLYNPEEKNARSDGVQNAESALYDPQRPAFTMSFDQKKTEWRLVQEKCEHCRWIPKHRNCDNLGKQQVMVGRHERVPVGSGIFNCMDAAIPGIYSDSSRVIWCPTCSPGDLGKQESEEQSVQHFVTKVPAWNDEVESLVLDFKGRTILSSAKNFQLALRKSPDHVVCQYGKIGPNTFGLDFKYPLSLVQAFSMSLTTLFWQ